MNASEQIPDRPAALELTGVVKRFGSKLALDDVSLRVDQNEVVGLVGENGAGKSTLLKLIAGLHHQDEGQFAVHGVPQRLRGAEEAAKLGIGVVHQEQSLIGNLSVADNVTLGSEARRAAPLAGLGFLDWRRLNARAAEVLGAIGLDIDPRRTVSDLTFAQRQMVEIAKAVSVGSQAVAPIVVLDEPTSILEPEEIDRLKREVARLRTLGSVIFVSHRLQEVLDMCDRIYVLRDGKVVAERRAADTEAAELFQLMTGRAKTFDRQPPISAAGRPTALSLRGITTPHGVAGVDLEVAAGTIHCLVGSTSSGAEQLARACFGLEEHADGEVRVGGSVLAKPSPRSAIGAGIAYLPSERRLESIVGEMSVAENLTLARPVASGGFISHRKRDARTTDWIDRLDIRPPSPSTEVAALSGGNQQKVVLAKWLSNERLVALLLDHPLRGLDAGAIEYVKTAIRGAAEDGVGVLMIADTIDEALEIADTISVMKDGRVTATFDLATHQPTQVDLLKKMV